MNNKNKQNKPILTIYEDDCGGETIAHRYILREFKKLGYENKEVSLKKLIKTSFLSFIVWLAKSLLFSLSAILLLNKESTIVYTTTYTAAFVGVLFKKNKKVKIVFHYHGNRLPSLPVKVRNYHNLSQLFKYKLSFFLHEKIFKNADLCIFPSLAAKKEIEKIYGNIKKSQIITNGVDVNKFYELPKLKVLSLKNKYKIRLNEKYLLFVGRIEKEKGLLKLLLVLYMLNKNFDNVNLIIAYNSTNRSHLNFILHTIKKLKLTSQIMFIKNGDLNELYNIADLTLSFSKKETFSLVMLESLACNTVFASSHSATFKTLEQIDKSLCLNNLALRQLSTNVHNILSKKKFNNKKSKVKFILNKNTWTECAKKINSEFINLQSQQYQ